MNYFILFYFFNSNAKLNLYVFAPFFLNQANDHILWGRRLKPQGFSFRDVFPYFQNWHSTMSDCFQFQLDIDESN